MKKIIKVVVWISLTISSINYASQPASSNMWASISNWVNAKWQGLPQFMPNINFYQQAKNLVNRLNLDQRYTLYRIVRAALGIEEEKSIEKRAEPINLQPTPKLAAKSSQDLQKTTEQFNVLVIPKTTVLPTEDTIESIEKALEFEEVNRKRIWDKKNYKNVIIFLKQEQDNWNGLKGRDNINMVKCQLFNRNIYPIIQGVKTRSSFEVDIMFPILINKRHQAFGLKNTSDLGYYSGIMERYIEQCGLKKIWENKVKKELPQTSKMDNYPYGAPYPTIKDIK